jgi:hypothetical protein
MPVDEFGREIPGYVSKQSAPSPPRFEQEEQRYSRSRRSEESPPRRRSRPIERYVQEPMLCQFVWKDQMQRNKEDKEKDKDKDKETPEEESKKTEEEKDAAIAVSKETYDEYRQRYCLNYVRAFFNEHMDDSWFRNRYSPLARKRVALQHLERAAMEAHRISRDLVAAPDQFVAQARLGSGVKERSTGVKRKHGDSDPSENIIPTSHVFSISDRVVKLMDIPPHVSEKQIQLALLEHSSNSSAQIRIFSGSVNTNDSANPLYRDAFCVFENADVKKDILSNIQKASVEAEGHVPRKDDRKVVEFDVECSDPYGRLEVEDEAGGTVPLRKASIFIATGESTQKVVVLSAAVSSKTRISKDKEAAILMARALDVKHKIPRECRLDDLIEPLKNEDEDLLDVAIAYLRRVHLFSFYNGCVFSNNLADVLGGNHPSATIHLRLKDADEILQKNTQDIQGIYGDLDKEGEEEETKTTDLLVMRLDESIRKAQESTKDWVTNDSYVTPELDAEAAELEEQEKQAKLDWVNQHGVIDEDGRARCGFHFCRKLFKDMNFLEKHLHKKHSEFLKAEVAKCHDSYMMRAWDSGDIRPVPAILVDCGSNFSLVTSQVIGAATPLAVDPEPELWQKEEDRRKRLEEQEAQRDSQRYHHRNRRDSEGDGDGPSAPAPARRSNFVDVDDMKEEKVELSFENVEVQLPKKKKRKKLL